MKLRNLVAGLALVATATPAMAFLNNWFFNPLGTGIGGATQINQFLDFDGASYIQNYTDAGFTTPLPPSPPGTPFFFKDNGAFNVKGHDSGLAISGLSTKEVTTLYSGGTGTGTLGGALGFNAGGLLNFYSDAANNFGAASLPLFHYGADDGTPIGSFTEVAGCQSCFVDPSGLPTGALALFFQATSLTSGYWFDPSGNPLAAGTILGFATVNGSFNSNPPAAFVSDIAKGLAGATLTYTNTPPTDFVIANNGQFRLAPEPTTVTLLGAAILALGFGIGRRAKK